MADPPRVEDHRLLTGQGAFIADLALPGALHALILRSPHAHATIDRIDTAAARAAPGVQAVLTAAELVADGIGGIPWEVAPPTDGPPPEEGDPATAAPQDLPAKSRVHYVGEPVALIAAETKHQAQDARRSRASGHRTRRAAGRHPAARRLAVRRGPSPRGRQSVLSLRPGGRRGEPGRLRARPLRRPTGGRQPAPCRFPHPDPRLCRRLEHGHAKLDPAALQVIPTPSNLVGAKAVGEAGPTAAPPAVINAITDALGIDHIEMPATPERVWRALRRSRLSPPGQHPALAG